MSPKVGSQEYPYTPAGQKAAKKEGAKTGKPVQMKPAGPATPPVKKKK